MSVIKCDILICGSGLAGLSLLYRAMKSGLWTDLQIIVADRSEKQVNDKTWSFWQQEDSVFEELVQHKWKNLIFYSHQGRRVELDNKGYTYKSIRSGDFYRYTLAYLKRLENITFVQEEILNITSSGTTCKLYTDQHTYQSTYLFNSIYQQPHEVATEQLFLQHFKGQRIRTRAAIPSLSEAYLMDFRTGQENGTSFFYTLPMAEDELFVEYTLFSKSLLSKDAYDEQIKHYLREVLKIEEYTVLEEEFGIIPMTDHLFKRFDGNIIHIGTAGGDTRGSTGYTFSNLQKTITSILVSYQEKGHPFFRDENISLRYQLYDSTLLNVLDSGNYAGHELFTDLFSKSPAYLIFAFLDAETSLTQDTRVMKSLRIMPFLRAFIAAAARRLLS